MGLGMPCAWQGWLVHAVAFGLLLAGPFLFSPFREPIAFQLYTGRSVGPCLYLLDERRSARLEVE